MFSLKMAILNVHDWLITIEKWLMNQRVLTMNFNIQT